MTCQKLAKQEAAAWMTAAKGLEDRYPGVFAHAENEMLNAGKVQLSFVDAHSVAMAYVERCLSPEGLLAVHNAGCTPAAYRQNVDKMAMCSMTGEIAVSCNYRMTQQVVSFDPTISGLLEHVAGEKNSVLNDAGEPLPTELLARLPFDTFVIVPNAGIVRSYLVHCVQAGPYGPGELMLSVVARMEFQDGSIRQVPVAVMLEMGRNLSSAIQFTRDLFHQSMPLHSDETEEQHRQVTAAVLAQVLPYLLYLSAENRELDGDVSSLPKVVATKKGRRLFARESPNLLQAGVRIGAAIRAFQEQARVHDDSAPTGSTVVPHLRKAHWHTFWTGPRHDPAKRHRILRFLPPIPVNVDRPSDLQAVVRPARIPA